MNVLRVLSQTVEIEPGVIEKGGSDFPHDDRRGVIYLGLIFLMETDDFVLPVLNDTVETSQDRERKNDVPVLVGFEQSSQNVITNVPDECRNLVLITHMVDQPR